MLGYDQPTRGRSSQALALADVEHRCEGLGWLLH